MKLLYSLLISLLSFSSSYEASCIPEFFKFVKTYNKDYSHHEVSYRYNIFCKNLDFIKSHKENWNVSINEFTDLTFNEFKERYYGVSLLKNNKNNKNNFNDILSINLPSSIDWREKGAVTSVKNQGMCGSCWAFSTTGAIEGAWVLLGNSLVSLSEQQLVDCAKAEGNNGCNGGLMDYGFQYVINNNGLCEESSYSYTGTDGTCKKTCNKVVTISSFKDLPTSELALLNAVGTIGPVSVAIEADQRGFQFYSGGVFDGLCGTNLDHGVLVVGYGTDNNKDYWIIKNSWGSSWGENGYIKLIRGKNQCGITLSASYPIV